MAKQLNDIIFNTYMYSKTETDELLKSKNIKVNHIEPDEEGNISLDNLVSDKDGKVYKIKITSYPGEFWEDITQKISNVTTVYFTDEFVLVGTKNKGLFISNDYDSFVQIKNTDGLFITDIKYSDNIFIASTKNNGVYFSDNGIVWSHTTLTSIEINCINFIMGCWYAGSEVFGLFKSYDGKTWVRTNLTDESITDIQGTGTKIFVGTKNSGLWMSNDGNIFVKTNKDSYQITKIKILSDSLFIAGTYQNGVILSYDGTYWFSSLLKSGTVSSFANNSEVILASTDSGVKYSKNGNSWFDLSSLHNIVVHSVYYNYNIWAAVTDNGIYSAKDINSFSKTNILDGDINRIFVSNYNWFAVSDTKTLYSNLKYDKLQLIDESNIDILSNTYATKEYVNSKTTWKNVIEGGSGSLATLPENGIKAIKDSDLNTILQITKQGIQFNNHKSQHEYSSINVSTNPAGDRKTQATLYYNNTDTNTFNGLIADKTGLILSGSTYYYNTKDITEPKSIINKEYLDTALSDNLGNISNFFIDLLKKNEYEKISVCYETNISSKNYILSTLKENANNGDFLIIKTPINIDLSATPDESTKFSYTAYVYSSGVDNWTAMDGNYNAENVYFDSDFLAAGEYTQIGNIEKDINGTYQINSKGKSVKDLFTTIFTKTLQPTITEPTVSISLLQSGILSVGQRVTPSYTINFSGGKYQYGPTDTGVTVSSLIIRDSNNVLVTKTNPTFPVTGTLNSITINENTNYSISISASYTDGVFANNNLGDETDSYIKGKTITKTSSTIKSYIPYYISVIPKTITNITDETIKQYSVFSGICNNSITKNLIVGEHQSNPKAIVVAVPNETTSGVSRICSLESVLLVSASNTPITQSYIKSTTITTINNFNYNVWIYEPSLIGTTEEHQIKIS